MNTIKQHKRRAVELYKMGNLFRHKVERDRTKYNRKQKHKKDAE